MPTIDEIEIADEPECWAALGFALDGETCQLGGITLRLSGRRGDDHGDDDGGAVDRGILGWSLRGIDGEDLDGLPTTISERPPSPPALTHPNGVVSIDHVVAVSQSFERSVAALQAAGLDLRRVRDEPTPAGAGRIGDASEASVARTRQAFFRLGREILELVQAPDDVVASSGGPDRIARFWGLALLVDDIDATVTAISPHASEPRAAVQPGRRIATVSRSAGLAVPIALITREQDRVAG